MKNRIRSFGFALEGLLALVKDEPNARIHIVAAMIAIAAGFFLHVSSTEWICIAFAIAAVIATEAINTAIENMADFAADGYDERIKKIKDVAAGAVLVVAMGACITGLIIFTPKIIALCSMN
ncbi:MAG: diacylglycerol kinase family protein [Bacteroidia bacterium]|nr:diacylglycerol kinase family protein [Bacteroidia bacterium]